MSTEAMREAFEKWFRGTWSGHVDVEWELRRNSSDTEQYAESRTHWMWQAATANQEALIKAALDAAKAVCEGSAYDVVRDCAEAIDQITPQQVMERMK